MKYLIRSNYLSDDSFLFSSEKKFKHSIVETYECQTIEEMKKILCEMLDCHIDYNGNVVKPNYEDIKDIMLEYIHDEKFIKNEFSRSTTSYDAYNKIIEMLDKNATYATASVPEMNSNFEVMVNKEIK